MSGALASNGIIINFGRLSGLLWVPPLARSHLLFRIGSISIFCDAKTPKVLLLALETVYAQEGVETIYGDWCPINS